MKRLISFVFVVCFFIISEVNAQCRSSSCGSLRRVGSVILHGDGPVRRIVQRGPMRGRLGLVLHRNRI